jgi:C4-dicarboxylate-specific signal transduction histidine kinase
VSAFPSDEVLIARGKYSTVNAERRERMAELQKRTGRITDQARVLLRYDDNAGESIAMYEALVSEVKATGACLQRLTEVQAELDELKPAAWGKEQSE